MKTTTIAIVDDDPVLGEIMQRRLTEEGYECLWEQNGESGFQRIKIIHPDHVLLDIVMPEMNGYEVIEKMKADSSLKEIPIIVISNSGQPVEIQHIIEMGVKDYLVKAHFSPEEVINKVKGIVGPPSNAPLNSQDGRTFRSEDKTVLIVEDDTMLSEIAADRFRRDGYKVLTAFDGRDGIAVAREGKPDVILLDIIMPGMSGFEVLKELKENTELQSIPVIIFSNLAQDRDIAEGRRLGAIDFFVKANFTPAQVVERVKEILVKQN